MLDTTMGAKLLITGAMTVTEKGITTSIITGSTLLEVIHILISYVGPAKLMKLTIYNSCSEIDNYISFTIQHDLYFLLVPIEEVGYAYRNLIESVQPLPHKLCVAEYSKMAYRLCFSNVIYLH